MLTAKLKSLLSLTAISVLECEVCSGGTSRFEFSNKAEGGNFCIDFLQKDVCLKSFFPPLMSPPLWYEGRLLVAKSVFESSKVRLLAKNS